MFIVLSPAKTLDFETPASISKATTPTMLKQTAELVEILKQQSPKQIGQLMGISEKLSELNHQRYQDFEIPLPKKGSKQAALAFQGDVYQGLLATEMTEKQLLYAQDHLRILSGLYGSLRPLDRMLPYRLEMGTALKNAAGKDLYAFWGDQITDSISKQIVATKSKCLLNLASNEYFRSVKTKQLPCPVVAPAFKELKNGKYKIISFFAKKARGTMAAWVIRNKVKSIAKLAKFDEDGYRFDEESSTETVPVFLRG
jgi:cytoplasmic iron level regulating protein YaaA (DUF328/UPF0246 family)